MTPLTGREPRARHGTAARVPTLLLVLLLGPLWALAACGEDPGTSTDDTTASPTPAGGETVSPAPTEDTMTTSPDPSGSEQPPGSVVEQAVQDLAERLSVAPDQIAVVSQEEVTWRDGSMGCAEKGMAYTQALVDGRRIVLRADGTTYEYHSGRSGEPFYCEDPTE